MAEASLEVMTSFMHLDNNYIYLNDSLLCAEGPIEISGKQKLTFVGSHHTLYHAVAHIELQPNFMRLFSASFSFNRFFGQNHLKSHCFMHFFGCDSKGNSDAWEKFILLLFY